MRPYDVYIFFLCLVVFTALTALFSYLLYEIIKLTVRAIKYGLDDAKLIAAHYKPVPAAWKKISSRVFMGVLSGILLVCFAFSLLLHFSEDTFALDTNLRVVASASMANKHKKNTYLFENNLDNQLNTFDLIVTHAAPDEFELQLYDVVVYQVDDIYVIHRIVAIEEPNNKHPGHRLFYTQGDAVSVRDREPVEYSQIKAIYKGERIQFVGSFVFFMRSPAGWLCILLVIFAIIGTPIVEKRVRRVSALRLYELGIITQEKAMEMARLKEPFIIDNEEEEVFRDK